MTGKKIPVLIVTGFLGSGKTTLLNRLLSQRQMTGTLAIINEFGEIGLDHLLLEVTDERMALLDNGCVCCTVRDDLVDTLLEVEEKRQSGALDVTRVVLETTGLADPAPILHALMAHPGLEANYDIESVITLVDATSGASTLATHEEARKQLACADQIVLTKCDIAIPSQQSLSREAIAAINPSARLREVRAGEISADLILDAGFLHQGRDPASFAKWSEGIAQRVAYEMQSHHGHEHSDHCENGCTHSDVSSYAFTFEQPVDWGLFREWLENLAALKGPDLLRFKGIVHIAQDEDRPLVVHGVQHVFHNPKQLERWPSEDRRTRLVFIVKNIPREIIERTLVKFVALDPGHVTSVHLRELRAS